MKNYFQILYFFETVGATFSAASKNPASEKVNLTIAKVCGINPDDLIFETDLERAPENVKNIVELMVNYIKSLYMNFIPSINFKDDKKQEIFESEKNIILIPANQDFETLTISKKDIEIKGKVKSYTIEL